FLKIKKGPEGPLILKASQQVVKTIIRRLWSAWSSRGAFRLSRFTGSEIFHIFIKIVQVSAQFISLCSSFRSSTAESSRTHYFREFLLILFKGFKHQQFIQVRHFVPKFFLECFIIDT